MVSSVPGGSLDLDRPLSKASSTPSDDINVMLSVGSQYFFQINEIDITHQPRTPVTFLQGDFAAMEGFQFGAMPDAHDGDVRQFVD